MADPNKLLEAIKATKPMDLVNHPFSFAVGVGVANGLLAVARGKRIDVPTATALGIILGLGEAALVGLEPGHKLWSKETASVAWMSVLGVAVGVIPFVLFGKGEVGHGAPLAGRTVDAELHRQRAHAHFAIARDGFEVVERHDAVRTDAVQKRQGQGAAVGHDPAHHHRGTGDPRQPFIRETAGRVAPPASALL